MLISIPMDLQHMSFAHYQDFHENLSINMRKMSFDTEGDVFKGSITLRVKNKKIIDKLIQRIKKIKGVYKAVRD